MRHLCLLACLALASSRPAIAAPATRVAVIDLEKLYESGGIQRWLAARKKLDAEKPRFKVLERPKTARKKLTLPECAKPDEFMKDLCTRLDKLDRESVVDDAWTEHEREVLGPIEVDVDKELRRYAMATGIDVLIDRGSLEDGLVFVRPGIDITSAFIKNYNARRK